MSYLPCELHCHTVHSDGSFTPAALQEAAVQDGLSLIALTDHNTVSGHAGLNAVRLPFIPGIEWTTYYGHMLVLGAKRWVDWRDAVPENIDRKIAAVKAAGGLVGIAHPFQLGSPICTGGRWEFTVENWNNVDYIEIWHEGYTPDSYENTRSLALWTALLDKGFHIAATYGRDWHGPKRNGHACCTYLNIEGAPCAESALKAIRCGRSVVSAGARFFFTAEQEGRLFQIGDTLPAKETCLHFYTDSYARRLSNPNANLLHKRVRLISNGGACVLETAPNSNTDGIALTAGHWYRAELWGTFHGEETLLAVTSPIYAK